MSEALAGSSSRSPARATPPPMTKSSMFSVIASEAMAMPSARPAVRSDAQLRSRNLVTGQRPFADFGAGDGFARGGGILFRQRRSAGIGLQAAARTAVAAMSIGIDGHMSRLASAVALSVNQPSLINNGGADAGANDDVNHALPSDASAKMKFPERGCLGVVIQRDRQRGSLLQRAAKRRIGYARQVDQSQ